MTGGRSFEDPGPGGAIPVVLSRRLLEVYDKTIAPAWSLPRLPPGVSLLGLEMPVRIGLSIVRRIVADHRGTIAVGRSQWQGAEFIIRIPSGARA